MCERVLPMLCALPGFVHWLICLQSLVLEPYHTPPFYLLVLRLAALLRSNKSRPRRVCRKHSCAYPGGIHPSAFSLGQIWVTQVQTGDTDISCGSKSTSSVVRTQSESLRPKRLGKGSCFKFRFWALRTWRQLRWGFLQNTRNSGRENVYVKITLLEFDTFLKVKSLLSDIREI